MAKSNQATVSAPSARPAAQPPAPPPYRPPYLAAALATLGVFALYVITLAPTTAFWDASEYITTAHMLGIPHPPGNPLFVVLARAWELILAPTGLSVAVRVNLFSAVVSALAHGFWFLLVHRILAYYSDDGRFRLVGAAIAVLISATAFSVWNQSNVNEKVYTVSLFTIALLSWMAFRWRDNLGRGKDDNLIILAAYILALSVGNHLMAFLAAPALLLFVLLVQPRALLNWKLYAGAAVAVVLGLSIHLFLPLRAALDPVINEADPSTWQALLDALARRQYDKPSIFMSPVERDMPRDIGLVIAQIGNYLQYFDWQWARSVGGNEAVFGGMRPMFTLGFAALGAYGGYTHYKRDRISWAYVGLLFLTLSLGLVIYLNFRYGYAWALDRFPSPEMHEVRERDYFFIIGFSVWGLWAGLGLVAVWQRIAEDLVPRFGSWSRASLVTTPVLAVALIPLALNWSWASRAGDYAARDWAYNLLNSVAPYGVLFTNGDNDTFPLWYLQEVEGIRRDVTVIVMSYLNTPWYVKQLRALTTPCAAGVSAADDETRILCQRPFVAPPRTDGAASGATGDVGVPTLGAVVYAGGAPPASAGTALAPAAAPPVAPTKPILALSDADIERIANTYPFATEQPLTFRAGDVVTTLEAGTVMIPSDIFMTAILTQAIDDRPIYFASTTQAYNELNLRPYLIRQGVAYRLHDGPVRPDSIEGVYELPESPIKPIIGPYLDLPVTDTLLWDVFVHRGGIPDAWTHWVDDATQNIPIYYAYTHYAAAQVHSVLGNDDMAERHIERAEAWGELSQK